PHRPQLGRALSGRRVIRRNKSRTKSRGKRAGGWRVFYASSLQTLFGAQLSADTTERGFGQWQSGGQLVYARPHPCPLPRGEGDTLAPLRKFHCPRTQSNFENCHASSD